MDHVASSGGTVCHERLQLLQTQLSTEPAAESARWECGADSSRHVPSAVSEREGQRLYRSPDAAVQSGLHCLSAIRATCKETLLGTAISSADSALCSRRKWLLPNHRHAVCHLQSVRSESRPAAFGGQNLPSGSGCQIEAG